MGQWMDQVTRGWLIYQITGSPLQLGLSTAMRGIPFLLFGVVAGTTADRSGRKAQLVIAQSSNAVVNVILATLVVTHQVQPWHIYVTAFIAGTVQTFQQPARQTLISDIVAGPKLMNALALNSAALNASRTFGPAAAGIIIALIGSHGSYYVQAVLYVFATIWTLQMKVPDAAPEMSRQAREPFFQSMGNGLVYVAKERNIRTLMILALAPMTLGMPYISLMPIFAIDVLHGGSRLQGFLLGTIGAGGLAGALIVASMNRKNGYAWPVVMGATLFGISLISFALSSWVFLSIVLAGVTGIFSVTYQTQNQTLLQILAPRRLRGRVMSIFLLNRGLVPVGALIAGTLAYYLDGPRALLIMGSASLGVVALVLLISPGFLSLKVPFQEESPREPSADEKPSTPAKPPSSSP